MEGQETGYVPEEPAGLEEVTAEPVEPEPGEAEPAETEPVEPEPGEAEPAETEPVEPEPGEAEPVETEPGPEEVEPEETEPVEPYPGDPEESSDPEETPSDERVDEAVTDPEEDPGEETEGTVWETVSGNGLAAGGGLVVLPEDYGLSALGVEPADTEAVVQAVEKQTEVMTAGFTCTCFMLGLLAGAVLVAGFRLRRV